jgi:hypothetical protein
MAAREIPKHLFRYLDTVGDGSGNTAVTGNYSAATETFLIAPAAGETFYLNRCVVVIEDGAGIAADNYGAGTALSTGILIQKVDPSGLVCDFTDGQPIVSNVGWAHLCYDVSLHEFGAGNEFVTVRWTWGKSGKMVVLQGDHQERLLFKVHGDCDHLVDQHFMVQGFQT